MEINVILFFSGSRHVYNSLIRRGHRVAISRAVAKHTYKRQLDNLHPEFLDGSGSYVNEELLAVRFSDPDDFIDDDDEV